MERHYKWFCRISKTNMTKENSVFEYDFEHIFTTLCEKYKKVMYIVHDKDENNIHSHFIIQNDSQIRKETLLKIMPYGSCEVQRGSNAECYNYLLHKGIEGKQPYKEEDIKLNFAEELNLWLAERKSDGENYDAFINDIYNGTTDIELSKKYPKCYFRFSNKLDKIRELNQSERANNFRDVEVNYIYGESRTGKTYSVVYYCKERELSYCRVTDYQRDPFYNYNGEEVIIFDEYHSDFNLNCFLTYLEGYEKTQLPSRYRNKFALYNKVYIISNVPLKKQYEFADSETKKALYNRIKGITHYTKENIFKEDINGNILSTIENKLF